MGLEIYQNQTGNPYFRRLRALLGGDSTVITLWQSENIWLSEKCPLIFTGASGLASSHLIEFTVQKMVWIKQFFQNYTIDLICTYRQTKKVVSESFARNLIQHVLLFLIFLTNHFKICTFSPRLLLILEHLQLKACPSKFADHAWISRGFVTRKLMSQCFCLDSL